MKKLALQDEPRQVGELVNEIIEDAIAKSAGDMLREDLNTDSAKAKLKAYVERWERVEEEKQAAAADQNEILKEAAGDGFDKDALKTLLGWRKKGDERVKSTLALVAVYHDALGMDVLP